MAISRTSFTGHSDNGGVGTTLTFAATVSGSNTSIKVGCLCQGSGTVTATFNGDAMTQIGQQDYSATNRTFMFERVAPDDGTHNVVLTTSNSGDVLHGSSGSFAGASQTLPTGDEVKSGFSTSAVSSPITLNPVSIADDSWAFSFFWAIDQAETDGTNNIVYTASQPTSGDSDGALSTAGTETVNAAWVSGNSRYVFIASVFAPAGAPPRTTPPAAYYGSYASY